MAAKHGVIGLTRTAALEYARAASGSTPCPGFIETPMLQNAGLDHDDQLHQAISNMHAMKRMGKTEEVPGAILWLASDHATFVTGAAITVDGGFTAQ